jgi:hypothetical protein
MGKNLIIVPLTLKYSVPHVVNASFVVLCYALLLLAGVIAGGSVHSIRISRN